MWFMIILKVTEKQGFTLFLENTVLEKPQEWGSSGTTSLFKGNSPTATVFRSFERKKNLVFRVKVFNMHITSIGLTCM